MCGSVGLYSSYIGFVPHNGVRFVTVAAGSITSADLNAYAALISEYLPTMEETDILQAKETCGELRRQVLKFNHENLKLMGRRVRLSLVLVSRGVNIRSEMADLNG